MNTWRHFSRAVIDTFYPATCAGCGCRGVWLCDDCAADYLPLKESLCCDRCGHPLLAAGCGCRGLHPAITRVRAVAAYDGWLKQAIVGLKYRGESDRAEHLGGLLVNLMPTSSAETVLVPVPLHRDRERWRGFNQALALATAATRSTGLRIEEALVRTRSTHTQVQLNRQERISNLEGAFTLAPGWRPRAGTHYVLVDDVFTTGATMWACADVLDMAGARRISVLTLALDLMPKELGQYRNLYAISVGQ